MLNDINKNKYIHMIGIGGVSMSGIAKILLSMGFKISGSDSTSSSTTEKLSSEGIKISIGQSKDNINDDIALVAYTAAVKDDNPELMKARDLNILSVERSVLLGNIMDNYNKSIAVAGTHGKTTTSGLCAYVLEKGGLNPSYVVGGIIPEIDTNGAYNNNEFFIAELDESDGTIAKYSTDIAVINNMEEDSII